MLEWLNHFLEESDAFMPHGNCYLWMPSVLWLQVLGDAITALAYYSIPFALWYFVHKRIDLAFRWVFVLFGVFILLCGTTHLLSIWTIWHPDYWLEGFTKLLTGIVSIAAAVLIWPLIPDLLNLPSPELLRRSEAYIRAIFDASPDTMIISDDKGVIKMVNGETERLLLYRAEELVGKSILTLIPQRFGKGCPMVWSDYAAAGSRSTRVSKVVQVMKKNGTEIDVAISLSPIHTEQELLLASAIRDVTQQKQAEAALQASEERFRRMANVSPAMIWITDESGNPVFVNQTWLNFTGMELGRALTRQGWFSMIHPDDRHLFTGYYQSFHEQKSIVTEYRIRRAQGDWRWVLDHGVPILDKHGMFCGYIGSAIDITERKQSEIEFRIAATAFESQEAMVITDKDTVILRVNKTFCDSTGYAAEEVIGQKMNLLKSGRHDDAFYTEMWETINKTGIWQGEVWDRRKNGEIFPKWLTITAVRDADGIVTNYVGTHIDISERKAAEEEIKHLAFYDPLTKLPNRRLLRDRLQLALAGNARNNRFSALFFIDLDNFKSLNDIYGHDEGDLLLKQVSVRLENCVRECDTVARLGGDEFVVLLNDLGERLSDAVFQAETVGEKILNVLNEPYQMDRHVHHSTPSIGATLFSSGENAIDDLLKQADIAMYQAKAAGRNTFRFFDTAMQAEVTTRAQLEEELRQGIAGNQFEVYYQPQVDRLGEIIGAEALLRWRHPQRGLVGPHEFIPLAEETGRIVLLGQYVLETVCKRLAEWAGQGPTAALGIAVNISVLQFSQPDFVATVTGLLQRFNIRAGALKLEITESLFASHINVVTAKMTALKQQGVVFSIDDFGTGYSSLYYLKRLPLDQLKIDQRFVKDILLDANDAAIAKMIIALSQSIGLEVIAEGVESREQCEFLDQLGCYHYQGYLFGKPVAINEFTQMLADNAEHATSGENVRVA